MRCLVKNQRSFYYSILLSKTEITDEYGNNTGQYTLNYSTPVLMKANISPSLGTADRLSYGIANDYTKTIVTNDLSCPIKEDSILWIDKAPYTTVVVEGVETQVLTTHNYIVVSVAKSINTIFMAVKEVIVS